MLKNKTTEQIFNYSESESRRFNMNIYRAVVDKIDVRSLKKDIIANQVDIGILRVQSNCFAELSKLNQLGFPYINADTLVYYHIDLAKHQSKPYRNQDLTFEIMSKDDIKILDALVEEIFVGYTNHYFSNPYIDKQSILEGYQEWVQGFLDTDNNNKICYLVKKDNAIAGFATVAVEGDVGEGVLYGVLPAFAGQGIYSDIIRYTLEAVKNMGLKTMKVSTQIQNYAVQKVWVREQFYLKESYATIHINAFLKHSKIPKKQFEFSVSEEEIEAFGKMSGDMNPVHFDDTAAQEIGFKSRIAHGLIGNSILSKYYGMDFPGNGTLFLGYNFIFLAPIYPNQTYSVEITFYNVIGKSGIYEALAKITDARGKLCLLSYNTLKNNSIEQK